MRERTYTTFQMAEICGVYPSTVINWVKSGELPAFRTPGGHRRILESDVQAFLKKFKFPVPTGMQLGKRKILIVEDDPVLGPLLVRSMKKLSADLSVRWIDSGVEALIALGKEAPDLMILDVVMPNVDGARVLATLRSDPETAHIKVIGITGKKLPPDKLKYMEKHTNFFMQKPPDFELLEKKALALLLAPEARKGKSKALVKPSER